MRHTAVTDIPNKVMKSAKIRLAQKVNFAIHLYHAFHHALSTKNHPETPLFSNPPQKHQQKHKKPGTPPNIPGPKFFYKNTLYREAFCTGTGSAKSPSTSEVTSCISAS
jgi:hypothetical protein